MTIPVLDSDIVHPGRNPSLSLARLENNTNETVMLTSREKHGNRRRETEAERRNRGKKKKQRQKNRNNL